MSWVLLQLKQDYLDPSLIDPQKMLRAILQSIEQRTPEVEIKLSDGRATVTANGQRREFELGSPQTVWEMNFSLRPLMSFLKSNLSKDTNLQDVEIAAINGMLSTLDPHSNLLPPELFREMQLKTTGEFGGLGIRISIRNGALTIISPMPDTPASRMGLKTGDQIVRIDDLSTVNMPLDEAVSLLRGKPGTKVTIWVMRRGWSEPRKFEMTRERIEVHSVESHLLQGGVGYIQIQDFGRHTDSDVRQHLYQLKREAKGLKGLILDLRDNAGGLMTAAIKVADLFLEKGVIVATVSYSEDSTAEQKIEKSREEKQAESDDTEKDLPLVVLVNGGSASASEILAGALKNHGRALLIGEQTFGKGTVQILNDRVPRALKGACLKLTVAEYLIPGDVSIQEIGVTPDLALKAMAVTRDRVLAFAERRRFGEKDIPAHLRQKAVERLKPQEEIAYLDEEWQKQLEKDQQDDQEEPPLEDPAFEEDFTIRLARRLLEVAPAANAQLMMEKSGGYLSEVKREQQLKLQQSLEKLGVDWSAGQGGGGPLKVTFTVNSEGVNEPLAQADKRALLRLEVTNQGEQVIYRLRAESRSTFNLFDRLEFIFGKLQPGETRSWEVPVKIPRFVLSRTDEMRFVFFSGEAEKLAEHKATIATRGLERPAFGLAWLLDDGNNGLAEKGEKQTMALSVFNLGGGRAYKVKGLLKNEAGRDLFIKAGHGRFDLGELAPGAFAAGKFQFEIKPAVQQATLPVAVTIWDADTNLSQTAKLQIPLISAPVPPARKAELWLRTATKAPLRAGPSEQMPEVGWLTAGAVLHADQQLDGWYRVVEGGRLLGWLSSSQAKLVKPPKKAPAAPFILALQPPRIELEPLVEMLPAASENVVLKGAVMLPAGAYDVMVWLGSDKIFLARSDGGERRVPLEVKLSLKPGPNLITVSARGRNEFGWQKQLIVNRQGGLESGFSGDELAEEQMQDPLILE